MTFYAGGSESWGVYIFVSPKLHCFDYFEVLHILPHKIQVVFTAVGGCRWVHGADRRAEDESVDGEEQAAGPDTSGSEPEEERTGAGGGTTGQGQGQPGTRHKDSDTGRMSQC